MRSDTRTLTRHEAIDLIEQGWRSRRVCCPDAAIVPCVCRLCVRCPTHGLICVGSHD
jgi:hypothetical protein